MTDEQLKAMSKADGFSGDFFMYTILIGDIEECYRRTHYWWERNKQERKAVPRRLRCITIAAQPYLNFTSTRQNIPQWQKDMAEWANMRQYFNSSDFMDYEPRKGSKCAEYFKR